MKKNSMFYSLVILLSFGICAWNAKAEEPAALKINDKKLTDGLRAFPYLKHYSGGTEDGGLAHIHYWKMDRNSEEYKTLACEERAKVNKMNEAVIHAAAFQPTQIIPGHEATGLLVNGERWQNVSLKVPENWNGKLIVAGTPGLRNEYTNEAVFVPWLLEDRYAYVVGDKGVSDTLPYLAMLSGNHPTQHWGEMMLDLAKWAKARLKDATGQKVTKTYAVGLSNGGYQTRRALEIDHERVLADKNAVRLFDGGLDWSGMYCPDKRVLDADGDGSVSVSEYENASTLVGNSDRAARAMGWAFSENTQAKPWEFWKTPRFPGARNEMKAAGFSCQSAIYWGYYNTYLDQAMNQTKDPKTAFRSRGIGYYNLVSYLYRAELLGHKAEDTEDYSCLPILGLHVKPPLYGWIAINAKKDRWTNDAVQCAIEIANTGEFSVPLVTVAGRADALLGVKANAIAYRDAVERYGDPSLYRQYIVENAGHADAHSDGLADFDFDGWKGNEGVADRLTPMQAYVQRAFKYMADWVEKDEVPPVSKTISTDPADDQTDPTTLSW